MKELLFIGDINVDLIMGGLKSLPVLDHEITCGSFDITLGSSAVITACTYSALGGKASFLGLAGKDQYGNFMLKGMKSFDINTDLIRFTNKKTGVTVNLIYKETRSQITYPGAITEFKASDIEKSSLSKFNHIHFAGVYQQTNFQPNLTEVLSIAKAIGITTSLDPQWDESEKWEKLEEWLPMLNYLFVNKDEAISITKRTFITAALNLLKEKTNCPIIKAGKDGAYAINRGTIHHIRAPGVKVIDTIGAGDSFDAGFLFATLEKNMALIAATEFATAVGSRCCEFIGGVNARSSYLDILTFMEKKK